MLDSSSPCSSPPRYSAISDDDIDTVKSAPLSNYRYEIPSYQAGYKIPISLNSQARKLFDSGCIHGLLTSLIFQIFAGLFILCRNSCDSERLGFIKGVGIVSAISGFVLTIYSGVAVLIHSCSKIDGKSSFPVEIYLSLFIFGVIYSIIGIVIAKKATDKFASLISAEP